MYNSQNLQHGSTFTVKQDRKPVKQFVDRLTLSELHVYNAKIAAKENQAAIREMQREAINSLDGNWASVLIA